MEKSKNLIKVCLVLFIPFLTRLGYAQTPATDPLYDSVFVENFDTSVLNTTKWQVHYDWGTFFNTDTVRCWSNDSLFYVHSLNFNPLDTVNRKISGGTCKLIALDTTHMGTVWTYPSPCNSPECAGQFCFTPSDSSNSACFKPVQKQFRYSSAMLQSRVDFKYGYFEIRFRFPGWAASPSNAFHPAFWMYSGTTSVPWSEIDIFEIYGTTGRVTDAIHVDATVDSNPFSTNDAIPNPLDEPIIDLSQWHTMGCNWTPDSIVFYMDGNFLRRNTPAFDDTNRYLSPMPLILENAVNLWFGCLGVDSINAQFPFTLEADYIKAWQPKQACDTNKTYCNVTTTTFNSKIYKSLTIGGSSCSAVFNNGKASAVANDFVLLQEGFEVGTNMEMLINIEPCWTELQMNLKTNSDPVLPPPNLRTIYMNNHEPTD